MAEVAARDPRRLERGPVVAGVEVAAGALRTVVGRREDGMLRVSGSGTAPLAPGAVRGGLVVDRTAVANAINAALQLAEGRERSTRIVVAVDGDDLRTYHGATLFERPSASEPIVASEVARASRESREGSARAARLAAAEDPALRGVASTILDERIAGFTLDGRELTTLNGFHGRAVTVHTDIALAPLLHAGAISGAFEAARRRATATSGAYAVGRLLAESGFASGGVLRLGADITAYAVIRDGRVVATRVFGLGRDVLVARPETRAADAAIWARCVLAPHEGLEGRFPTRWAFVGVPEELIALPRALGEAVAELRAGDVDIAPLKTSVAGRLVAEGAMHPDLLIAAGAAALAAEIY